MNKLPIKKIRNLPFIVERPQIPTKWDYDESVKEVKSIIYKWKTLTVEFAQKLYIAREKLRNSGRRTDLEITKKN